jgi:hypothetical protein
LTTTACEYDTLIGTDRSEIRFINSSKEGNRIGSEQAAQDFVKRNARFDGGTRLGTALDERILQPLLLKPARNGTLKKPVLIIVITDGEPVGEPRGKGE